jgi:hypothetical protein
VNDNMYSKSGDVEGNGEREGLAVVKCFELAINSTRGAGFKNGNPFVRLATVGMCNSTVQYTQRLHFILARLMHALVLLPGLPL